MGKSDDKRAAIAERLADFVLAQGLPRASLRPLAAAAGLSDRMLLYYFRDKDEVLETTLALIAERISGELAQFASQGPQSRDAVEAKLIEIVRSPRLWPHMCVWLEIAACAARGDSLCRRVGAQIADGFQAWIAELLSADLPNDRLAIAGDILRLVEGEVVLQGVRGSSAPAGRT